MCTALTAWRRLVDTVHVGCGALCCEMNREMWSGTRSRHRLPTAHDVYKCFLPQMNRGSRSEHPRLWATLKTSRDMIYKPMHRDMCTALEIRVVCIETVGNCSKHLVRSLINVISGHDEISRFHELTAACKSCISSATTCIAYLLAFYSTLRLHDSFCYTVVPVQV